MVTHDAEKATKATRELYFTRGKLEPKRTVPGPAGAAA